MKEWSMFSKWPDCRAFVSCCTEVGHAEFPKGCIDLDDLMSCSDCRKDQEVSWCCDVAEAISVGADGSVASWYVKREDDDMVLGGRFPGEDLIHPDSNHNTCSLIPCWQYGPSPFPGGDGGAVLSLASHPVYPGVAAVGCEDTKLQGVQLSESFSRAFLNFYLSFFAWKDGDVWIWGFKPDFREGFVKRRRCKRRKRRVDPCWSIRFHPMSFLNLAIIAGNADVAGWEAHTKAKECSNFWGCARQYQ